LVLVGTTVSALQRLSRWDGWTLTPTQLFANIESYGKFVRALHSYEECYKLIDPWWSALRTIACGGDDEEEGYSTAADVAERFNEVLNDLPKQWAKPTKKKPAKRD